MTRNQWLVFVCGSLATLAAWAQSQPTNPSAQSTGKIEESGLHQGDNIHGIQNKVVVNGTVIMMEPQTAADSPAGSASNHSRHTTVKSPAPRSSPPQPAPAAVNPRECHNWPVENFPDTFTGDPSLFWDLTSNLPLRADPLVLRVQAQDFDRERRCAQLFDLSCLEYHLTTPDGSRVFERFWASVWEDEEKKGLLNDPARTRRVVECFSDDNSLPEPNPARFWISRLRTLAALLERPDTSQARGGVLHALYIETLERWAHLEVFRASTDQDPEATERAATIFGHAAAAEPNTIWLREAAEWLFEQRADYQHAAAEQQELLSALSRTDVSDTTLVTVRPDVLNATFELIRLRHRAGQRDEALRLADELLARLDSIQAMNLQKRRRDQAFIRALMGEILGTQGRWTEASRFYESAADLAAAIDDSPAENQSKREVADPTPQSDLFASLGIDDSVIKQLLSKNIQSDELTRYYRAAADFGISEDGVSIRKDRKPDVLNWLFWAGIFAHMSQDAPRIASLDEQIKLALRDRYGDRTPTWTEWRYFMTQWHLAAPQRPPKGAQAKADEVLDKLLHHHVGLTSPILQVYDIDFGPAPLHQNEIPTLAGLPAAYPFFRAHCSRGDLPQLAQGLGMNPEAVLYRSVLQTVAVADQCAKFNALKEAVSAYDRAGQWAAQLTQYLPEAGAFLEVAVLRNEVRFFDQHHLDPQRSIVLTRYADLVEVENTCSAEVKGLYQKEPGRLHAPRRTRTAEVTFGPMLLGRISLTCPFVSDPPSSGSDPTTQPEIN